MKRYPHKKLYAALVTALCAAPLAAQASDTVTVYGAARASVDITDDGITSVNRVSNGQSRLGFRGQEDLGNGLHAIFQFETLVNLDDGAGTTGTLLGTFRDSYVGVAGGFGTVALGATSSAYRRSTGKLEVWSDTMGDYNVFIGNVSNSTSTLFDQRERNSIHYWSPKMNGFQILATYGLDEAEAFGINRDKYSVSGIYESGPWYAALAYSLHKNQFNNVGVAGATAAHTFDGTGIRGGLSYTFNHDNTTAGVVYEQLAQDGAATRIDRDAWYAMLTHKKGNNTLRVAYARAGDNDAAADSGASWWTAGVGHRLSGRTELYALYARTDNERNARYGIGTGGSSGAVGAAAIGQDPSTFSIGVNHRF